jgi:hypothetical protein
MPSPRTSLRSGRRPASTFHVAPWGRDTWPGTAARPFATLTRARRSVRASTAAMSSDIIVNLRAGTYRLPEPFELLATEGDSGENGHRVVYQAYGYGSDRQEDVVISGGREISGWVLHDPARNVWRAEAGSLETRQLFVDGRRAGRAALPVSALGVLTRTESGYVTDSEAPLCWESPADMEVVYRGIYPWSEARCGIAGISRDGVSTVILMAQPAFGWAREIYSGHRPTGPDEDPAWGDHNGLDAPTWVENSRSFLTEGTFVLDRSRPGEHVLYYIPWADQDVAGASIVAPVLETLVSGQGTEDRPLHDVTIRGITFAHATWLRPGRPEGFLHFHGAAYYDGGPTHRITYADGLAFVTAPSTSPPLMPGNLAFGAAARVVIEGNRFSQLGASALAFSRGSTQNVIRGNVFADVSGSAVTLGDYAPGTTTMSRRNRIENNWVHDIGCEYHGSPGIYVTNTKDTTVANNQINDVPHCGIVVNGGDTARRAQVLDNLVFNSMKVLADGGGIYVTGSQGASYASGALVRGNVIHDTITSYNFGLYTDFGARWVTVQANVIYRGDTPVVLHVSPPLENVAFIGNFWDDDPQEHDRPPKKVVVGDSTRLPREGFEQALAALPAGADIMASAGLRGAWRAKLGGL